MSDIRRFKVAPNPEDRAASKAFKARWNDFIERLAEKEVLDESDLVDWRLEWGLVSRTFRENYLEPAIQRGIIEPFGRPTKYRICNPYKEEQPEEQAEQPKSRLGEIIDDRIIKEKIKEKMLAGPCEHECMFSGDTDCRKCGVYINLKNKDFLEE